MLIQTFIRKQLELKAHRVTEVTETTHLTNWMRKAKRTRLTAFKVFVQLLEGHIEGILAWTNLRLFNGVLEGMNNKIKLVSPRGFGFRTALNFIAAIYHSCANLPLSARR